MYIYILYVQLCNLQSEMNDEDLRNDCRETLTILSTSLLTTDVLPVALHTIREVSLSLLIPCFIDFTRYMTIEDE